MFDNDAIAKYLERYGFEQWDPKVALFDMDGTIYDSMPNHAYAWHEAMAKFGLDFNAEDSYATEGARGVDTIRGFVKRQLGKDISEAEAQVMYDEKARIYGTLPVAPIMPGVVEFMQLLQSKGIKIGVVTGSGQRPLFERIQRDFKEFLTPGLLVTAYDVKKGKPAPDPYLMGLEKAGNLQPWQGIVVENAPLGVRSGVASRCFTIAVNTGPLAPEVLLREQPDLYCTTLQEIRFY